ncbi:3'-5' exonuclease [Apilactobacillus apisilvae]|uniref:3'-5' exonuclease n=1 Tax=Apilactobacillus apisilvae TaxID=2923364 RepID=A0ABY4PH07_9LACO|nr:3'-5' exonuclease [Apilactobacillus apisilvae]UQS85098.1 3'-5' exonuclease [Apilactobacillus apisilvae]
MNFVAIDFETANSKRASACSLALTVVRNNQIVDEFYSLINPEADFNWRNIKVHGLHEKDVANAPVFPEIWPSIKNFFTSNQLIIAHNNSFDNSVLKNTLLRYNLIVPKYLTLDTLKTSKYFYPQFENHKLNTVCSYLNIDLHHHHNALDDSLACANILIHEQKSFGNDEIKPFIKVKK